MEDSDPLLLGALRRRGVASAAELCAALGWSQPTLSRRLAAAASAVLVLGRGKATRYALPQPMLGAAAQQPLHWVAEDGVIRPWGALSLLAGGAVHVQGAEGFEGLQRSGLPWFLAPLRAEGFLGRALARRLAVFGLPESPVGWTVEQQLFAALHVPDGPGALILGDGTGAPAEPSSVEAGMPAEFDALADAAGHTLPAGSSAGGEQAKFVAQDPLDGHPAIVKFSPPRGSPFGERWHALLQAEALALALLADHGVPVAQTRVVATARRTCLVSRRFDRIALPRSPRRFGRRHVVPLWAVHEAFVPGPMRHWAASCEALVHQRRLPPEAAPQAASLLAFGRLIGNTDMHFGNLSLWVEPHDVARGRFALAPLYDMLPMRWRPQPHTGELDWLPFGPEPADLASPAAPLAALFWSRVADSPQFERAFRDLAGTMHRRIADP
jgi:hypothetical protein